MATRDYYQILGVSRTATEKEIRAAYRKLARKHHPDVNAGDKGAEGRFKEINEAHQVLSTADSRKKYDQYGENWKHAGQMAGAGAASRGRTAREWTGAGRGGTQRDTAFDGFDIFGGPFGQFGGRGAQSPNMPGQDLEQPVDVALEEAFSGSTRTMQVSTPQGGTRRLEVKIPAGVKTGSRIRVAGEGSPGMGRGPKGDLWLLIDVPPHPLFEREGDDLRVEVPVPLVDAVLSGEIQVPTLTGSKLALKIPPETQNGRVFRLRGQGMPKLDGTGRGDLLAKVKVVLPEHLSPREQEIFQELKTLRAGR